MKAFKQKAAEIYKIEYANMKAFKGVERVQRTLIEVLNNDDLKKMFTDVDKYREAFNTHFAAELKKVSADPKSKEREKTIIHERAQRIMQKGKKKEPTKESNDSSELVESSKLDKVDSGGKTMSVVEKANEAIRTVKVEGDLKKVFKLVSENKLQLMRRNSNQIVEFKEFYDSKKAKDRRCVTFSYVGNKDKSFNSVVDKVGRYVVAISK